MNNAESIVQTQLEAYNRHDMEGFLATYDPGIRIYEIPSGELILEGHEAMRERYRTRFAPESTVTARITHRTVYGNVVIDDEALTGMLPDREVHATAIYEVKGGLIYSVWFVKGMSEEEMASSLAGFRIYTRDDQVLEADKSSAFLSDEAAMDEEWQS